MAKNKPTTDEHFIPQFYLKQFSSDGEKVYQYDALNNIQHPDPVSTKSICYKKNLYEFKNESGEFIYRNFIEKWFSIFEGKFSEVFRSIQSRSCEKSSFTEANFLSEKEMAFLIIFMSTIILRNPLVLQEAQNVTMEFFGDHITENTARNFVLQTCLPIYKELNIEDKNLLNPVLQFFGDMTFQIGITDKEALWTSDRPVVLFGDYNPVKLDEVIMPISPHLVLYMKPYERTRKGYYNRLVTINPQDVRYFNSSVVTHCKRWIYSKQPLTKMQIRWILNERKKYELL